MKVPLAKICDDLNFSSDRLSSQLRTLTFGILAVVWLFLSRNKEVSALKIGSSGALLGIVFLCVLTLLIDATQYWASYVSANAVRKAAERANREEAEYDEGSSLRRLQQMCSWSKQITALLAAVWLLAIVAITVSK